MHTRQGWHSCLAVLLASIWLSACAELVQPPVATPNASVQPLPATLGASSVATPTAMHLSAAELFDYALQQRTIGAYDEAAEAFFRFGQEYPADLHASQAAYYLAESFFLRQQYTSAIAAFEQYIAQSEPDNRLLPPAVFLLGRSAAAAGDHERALAAFQRYHTFDTLISPYALLLEAQSHAALQHIDPALQAYREAAAQDMLRTEQTLAFEQAAILAGDHERPAEAQQLYSEVLKRAQVPSYRAKILLEAAGAAAQTGDSTQQHAWLTEIISRSPETEQALIALEQLVKDSVPITPSLSADIYLLHERWPDALKAYDVALSQASGEEQLELRRKRALVLRSGTVPDYATALSELAAISAAAPDSEVGRQARLDWIQTRGQSGDRTGAITAYREFADAYPADRLAPEALWRAALLLERDNAKYEAAQQRLELARRFPDSSLAAPALEQAGVSLVRLNQPELAREAFQLLSKNGTSAYAARGSYWLGRLALDQADTQNAKALLEQVLQLAPDSYEAARAAELLHIPPQGQLSLGSSIEEADWQAFDQWLIAWAAPITTTLDISQDAGVVRALMLDEVWLHAEARAEWSERLDTWRDQPHALAQLAKLAYNRDKTYIALLAGLRLESLAEASTTQTSVPAELPRAMLLLLHPTPYAALVQQEAHRRGIDPRLMYALFRQESAFDPQATSWVGARGLAQVMPETGAGLAQGLGVSPFTSDDLYRPVISIRFGTSYLAQQLTTLDGNIQGALSAYNAGLGNTYRWEAESPLSDPDLFVEQIDFAETRSYVRRVYGFYGAYQRLYAIDTP